MSARDRRVLELVEPRPPGDQVDDAVDGLRRELDVAVRTIHEPHEHRLRLAPVIFGDERGHAPDAMLAHRGLVLLADRVEWRTASDLCEHSLGVDSVGAQHVLDDVELADVAPFVVTSGEQRDVGVVEVVGVQVADHDARLQRQQPGVLRRLVPHIGLAFGDVCLPEGEGHEPHLPVGAGSQPGDHVLVGSAREWAAVVERDSEGAGGHASPNPAIGQKIPVDPSPDPFRGDAEHDADRRAGRDVGHVVDLHVHPTARDHARQPVPEERFGQRSTVGQQGRREERRGRVPARKAAREGLAQLVRALAVVRWPGAAEQRLQAEVDEGGLDPQARRELDGVAQPSPGPSARPNPASCQIRLWSPTAEAT